MAPRRILNTDSRNSSLLTFCGLLILSSMIFISCGTTQKTTNDPTGDGGTPESTEETSSEISSELITQINANRSSLDDVFSSTQSDIPDVFRKESTARDIGDPNEGYRVQILSTRNVQFADSVANDFRFWADDAFDDYRPKAYVLFRQPYYKVHIGNFQFHNHAMKLNQFLKSKYPDAWVVHDEVEPNLVPSDTTSFDKK